MTGRVGLAGWPRGEKALAVVFTREESMDGFTRRRCLSCKAVRIVARSLGICGRCKEAMKKTEQKWN